MGSLTIRSAAQEITPFWQRIPRFFLYPCHFEHLIYISVLSVAPLVGFVLPVPNFIGVPLVFLGAWLALTRHAYKILDYTARGLLDPELYHLAMDEDDDERKWLPYKQFGIFLAMGLAVGLGQVVGSLLAGLVLVFVTLAAPASTMLLTLTRSFWAAINPAGLYDIMRAIGLPYLGLWAFLFLLSGSEQLLIAGMARRVSPWLLIPVVNFIAMYFTLIMFNMMGYVIYQYHVPLGVPVRLDLEAAEPEPETPAEIIGRLVGAGDLEGALKVAEEARHKAPDDLAAQERYHKLTLLAGRQDLQLAHGQAYLSLLLRKGRDADALKHFQTLQGLDAAFAPESPGQYLRLAESARRQRQFQLALNLVKGFDKRFPGHEDIPAVYLFAARIFSENFRQDGAARSLLETLVERYPDHPAGVEARQYLEVMDKLAAGTPAAPRPGPA